MNAHETLTTLPLEKGGWVAIQTLKTPVLDNPAPPSAAAYLHDVELAYTTCRALFASEIQFGGAINVLADEPSTSSGLDTDTAQRILQQLNAVVLKADLMRFEQKLLNEQDGLALLEARLPAEEAAGLQSAIESQPKTQQAAYVPEIASREADAEATGAWEPAWAPEVEQPKRPKGWQYLKSLFRTVLTRKGEELTAEQKGAQFVASEAPLRIEAERQVLESVKQNPTHFTATEAALALDAINHRLESTLDNDDIAEQILSLAATDWVLKNTDTTRLTAVTYSVPLRLASKAPRSALQ